MSDSELEVYVVEKGLPTMVDDWNDRSSAGGMIGMLFGAVAGLLIGGHFMFSYLT